MIGPWIPGPDEVKSARDDFNKALSAEFVSSTLETRVLDHGFVRLDAYMADDLSVVNSARVSFNNRHDLMEEGDDKLIGFLMKNRHGTPFEHNSFRFHVKAPLFVFREWQRHRISSFNEWSARYSELKDEFYIPENVRSQEGKPGAYTFVDCLEPTATWFREQLSKASTEAYKNYQRAISWGIAREQARFFLPLNIYSEMYYTTNMRSLMNFLSLRNHDSAMFEIREYAKTIESIVENIMSVTLKAFVDNGRIAP